LKAPQKKKASLLLVEDDPNLSLVVQDYLEIIGYNTYICKDGEEGYEEFIKGNYDLVILDVMMPKKDGFTLANDIRKTDTQTPIIFLTAKSLKEDRIRGFQSGCDDYIPKPFSTEELSLRIEAILRRCIPKSETTKDLPQRFKIGEYTFDCKNMNLIFGEQEKSLTRKESSLLKLLCEHKNNLLTREKALKVVWGNDDYFIGRSMDVFITKLRKHLKEDPAISITNVHGTGFKLEIKE
jgi:DNA-binding response OmpR family regulator